MTRSDNDAPGPLSYNAALVLQALAQGYAYGFEIMRAAHLPSGTVYPLLRRLEAGGLLESSWEDAERAHDEGRPPRRYYRATALGKTALAEARERLRAQQTLFGGPPVGLAGDGRKP
jgi:DNA-binding PadR family transcriptional regulator